jgi:hypothetical protein
MKIIMKQTVAYISTEASGGNAIAASFYEELTRSRAIEKDSYFIIVEDEEIEQ